MCEWFEHCFFLYNTHLYDVLLSPGNDTNTQQFTNHQKSSQYYDHNTMKNFTSILGFHRTTSHHNTVFYSIMVVSQNYQSSQYFFTRLWQFHRTASHHNIFYSIMVVSQNYQSPQYFLTRLWWSKYIIVYHVVTCFKLPVSAQIIVFIKF